MKEGRERRAATSTNPGVRVQQREWLELLQETLVGQSLKDEGRVGLYAQLDVSLKGT